MEFNQQSFLFQSSVVTVNQFNNVADLRVDFHFAD
jgi:hypothetical protein